MFFKNDFLLKGFYFPVVTMPAIKYFNRKEGYEVVKLYKPFPFIPYIALVCKLKDGTRQYAKSIIDHISSHPEFKIVDNVVVNAATGNQIGSLEFAYNVFNYSDFHNPVYEHNIYKGTYSEDVQCVDSIAYNEAKEQYEFIHLRHILISRFMLSIAPIFKIGDTITKESILYIPSTLEDWLEDMKKLLDVDEWVLVENANQNKKGHRSWMDKEKKHRIHEEDFEPGRGEYTIETKEDAREAIDKFYTYIEYLFPNQCTGEQ